MIRIRLAEQIAAHAFALGRRVELNEVAEGTGIHRTTLSKMINSRGYNVTASNLDRLCRFFECQVADLLVYVRDEDVPGDIKVSSKGPARKTATAAKTRVTPLRKARAKG